MGALAEAKRAADVPPREPYDVLDAAEHYARVLALPGVPFTPREAQVRGWAELEREGGLLHLGGVGEGKALLLLAAPTILGAARPLWLAPAGTAPDLVRQHGEWSERLRLPPLRLLSHEALSAPSGTGRLAALAPDLVLVDEAHGFRDARSPRWTRLRAYLEGRPDVRVAFASATLAARSVLDVAHLAEAALGARSPLPRDPEAARCLAEVIDPTGRPTDREWMLAAPLLDTWGAAGWRYLRGDDLREAARFALLARLASAPGVVLPGGASSDAEVRLRFLVPPISYEVDRLVREAEAGRDPEGAILPDDGDRAAQAKRIAVGYWHRRRWDPAVSPDLREQWLRARSEWGAALDLEISKRGAPGYDSGATIGRSIGARLAAGVAPRTFTERTWAAWAEIRPLVPEPEPEAIWIDRSILVDAVERVREGGPAILWYAERAVADLLSTIAGVRVVRAGEPVPIAPRHRHLALSLAAHGRGLNLQAWERIALLQPPAGGARWEQVIGRVHRAGQEASEVEVLVLATTPRVRALYRRGVADARFLSSAFGSPQRLLAARLDAPEGALNR